MINNFFDKKIQFLGSKLRYHKSRGCKIDHGEYFLSKYIVLTDILLHRRRAQFYFQLKSIDVHIDSWAILQYASNSHHRIARPIFDIHHLHSHLIFFNINELNFMGLPFLHQFFILFFFPKKCFLNFRCKKSKNFGVWYVVDCTYHVISTVNHISCKTNFWCKKQKFWSKKTKNFGVKNYNFGVQKLVRKMKKNGVKQIFWCKTFDFKNAKISM